MDFEIACICGQHMLVEDRYVGQEVECPGCAGVLTVPEAPERGAPVPVVEPDHRPVPEPAPPPPLPSARPVPPPWPTAGPVPAPPPPIDVDYGGGMVEVRRTSGKAVAALVLAIVGMFPFFCPVVASVIALVLASQAKDEIRFRPELYTGMGIATAAQVCAVIGLLGTCTFYGCPLAFF